MTAHGVLAVMDQNREWLFQMYARAMVTKADLDAYDEARGTVEQLIEALRLVAVQKIAYDDSDGSQADAYYCFVKQDVLWRRIDSALNNARGDE